MPLVIAVLIILVLIVNIKDSNAKNATESSIYEKSRRKTNAKLEQRTLDMYMKHGYSFDEAFRKACEDMVSAGYDPCIPRAAYKKNSAGTQSSFCGYTFFRPEEFDSFLVQQKREDAMREWQQDHPDIHISEAPPEEIERMTYDNFPTTESAYLRYLGCSSMKSKAEPVGSFIIYPGLGTCEVLAHNWIGDGYYGGTYTLKVLKTGQVVTHVKIDDKRIERQG